MHDIDRGGSTTAARLAALAALRKAQGEGAFWEARATAEGTSPARPNGRGRNGRSPDADATETELTAAPRLAPDGSAGVFAAVDAAVRKSRQEFIARLVEYRERLDCDSFKDAHADLPEASLDKAQFIAHRIAGVGKTSGFADLGDAARHAEAAIVAYKLERSPELRKTSISRVCKLSRLIEVICTDKDNCPA